MSEVKVDTISERTADAGVTVEGVKIEDGVATFQTAAGSPLVFEGATADAFETTFAITDPTADRTITFPDSSFTVPTSGGVTHSSQWRVTSGWSGSVDPIKLNWGAVITSAPDTNTTSPTSSTALGAPMSVNTTTGYWTFPTTGMWFVEFVCTYDPDGYNGAPSGGFINYTTDDGSSVDKISPENGMTYAYYYNHSYNSVVLKIENTSEDKVSFSSYTAVTTDFIGSATMQWTWATFTRLADT